MNLDELLPSQQIQYFCQKYHIRQLSFFGSVVRDDFGPESDIDVLVEFEPNYTPGLDFFLIEAELSRLVGRRVDLQTLNFLSPEIQSSVLAEAVPAYGKRDHEIALRQIQEHAREAVEICQGKERSAQLSDRLLNLALPFNRDRRGSSQSCA